jgi:hypothetical protein
METRILEVPNSGTVDAPVGVPFDGTTVTIPSGTDYTSFGTLANVYKAGEPILFTGPVTGTLTESGGMFNQNQIILPGLSVAKPHRPAPAPRSQTTRTATSS